MIRRSESALRWAGVKGFGARAGRVFFKVASVPSSRTTLGGCTGGGEAGSSGAEIVKVGGITSPKEDSCICGASETSVSALSRRQRAFDRPRLAVASDVKEAVFLDVSGSAKAEAEGKLGIASTSSLRASSSGLGGEVAFERDFINSS